MLGLLGLFGAVMAGIMADSFLNHDHDAQAEDPHGEDDTAHAEPAEDAGHGDLLDDPDGGPDMSAHSMTTEAETTAPADPTLAGTQAGMPSSDDLPDPRDPAITALGTASADRLAGLGGSDRLYGAGGSDDLTGRDGDDRLWGGEGADSLHGGAGDDWLRGGRDDDRLEGQDGNDRLGGGGGDDQLDGGMGDDTLWGGAGADRLNAGAGHDRLDGGAENDTIEGGAGDDRLTGGKDSDDLSGGAGNDTLWGGLANGHDDRAVDFLNGGAGDDVLHLGAGDYGNGGEGADSYILDDHFVAHGAAEIADWHPGEDRLVVVYDPASHPDPTLEVHTASGSPDATITLDGVPIAHVSGGAGLTVAQIQLQAQSMAA